MFSFLYFLLLHFIFTSGPIRFDSFYYNTSIIQTRMYTYSPCVLVFSIKNIVHNEKKRYTYILLDVIFIQLPFINAASSSNYFIKEIHFP